jgi:hypothetical protein
MTTKSLEADHLWLGNHVAGPTAARGRLAESSVGQAMLTDYGNSLQSLPGLTPVGQRLPGCPLDPAASKYSEQLLFPFGRKRPGGRPKVPGSELRKIVIPVRFTETEALSLRSEAARCSISVATLIVTAALQRKPPRIYSPVTIKTYRQISGIAINVNQLTHRANRGVVANREVTEVLQSVRAELAAIVLVLSRKSEEMKDDE